MYVCAPTNVVWYQRVLEEGVLDTLKLQLQIVVSARNWTWVLCSKLPRSGNFTHFTIVWEILASHKKRHVSLDGQQINMD